MKHNYKRILSLLLAILLVATLALPAMAIYEDEVPNRSSAYIGSYYADITKVGNRLDVYYNITGTGTMTDIGATDIIICNQSGYPVAILDSGNTTGLMGHNVPFYSNTVSWFGASSGTDYYAIVGFKCADSTGYDTTCYTTLLT